MSYFDKYVSFHFTYFDESISGWSDLSSKQKLIMSLKILTDSFGVLMILVIISEVINWGRGIISPREYVRTRKDLQPKMIQSMIPQ